MTIGDVLAVVFGVIGIGLTGWATLVGLAVLFARRSARAQNALQEQPWRVVGSGALIAFTVGALMLVLINQPNGLGKLAGWFGIIALLGVAALGASGLAALLGSRLQMSDEDSNFSTNQTPCLSRGAHAMRGAGLLMAACGMPLVGWFTVLPFAFVAGLGAGATALRRPAKTAAAASQSTSVAPTTFANVENPTAANRWEPAITNVEAPR